MIHPKWARVTHVKYVFAPLNPNGNKTSHQDLKNKANNKKNLHKFLFLTIHQTLGCCLHDQNNTRANNHNEPLYKHDSIRP
jgi:hypothetical protein